MVELPTGTVTFLFTDIEGSTRLLKHLGEGYAAVLADHQRIIRDAAVARGGREIDTQGDSFFFVFARANAALGAAVVAQRGLAEHPWPEDGRVRVRMGLHTGEPSVGDDRYVGMGVHRAARIGAAAHGGQILLSNATRELVEDDVGGVSIRQLGVYRLKDIDRSELLFQVDIEGLQAEFPPLKAERIADRPKTRRRTLLVGGLAGVVAAAIAIPLFAYGLGSSEPESVEAFAGNSVGLVDPASGRLVADIPVGTAPTNIALGADAAWVTNAADNTVDRIDPRSRTVRQTIRVGRGPDDVAYGAGSLWVANGQSGTVSRIDPGSNEVTQTIRVGSGPSGIAVGLGAIWVVNRDDHTLTKLAADSGRFVRSTPVGTAPVDVAVGVGAVWVTSSGDGRLLRIEPTTGRVVQEINVGRGPEAVAVGADAVWVANTIDGTVSRIDAETLAVRSTIEVGSSPSGLAIVDGAVWVSDEFGSSLVRIDPATNSAAKPTVLGARPAGIAADASAVYVAARPAGATHRGGTLTFLELEGRASAYESLDPALFTPESMRIMQMTHDGLTAFRRIGGREGAQVVANLATTVPRPTDGGTTYSFMLRRGIRYSNGATVRAADVRSSLERAFELRSDWIYFLDGLVGARRCMTSRRCDLSDGVVVDDASRTVTIRLTRPDPELPAKLAFPVAAVVSSETPRRDTGRRPLPATGPYMVASFAPRRQVRLVRNPHFRAWSPARPDGYPDEIVIRLDIPEKARVGAVARGDADATTLPRAVAGGGTDLAGLRARYGSRLRSNPGLAAAYVALNVEAPPFDDVRVRRAVNLALDRGAVVRAAGGVEWVVPTCQVLPPNFPGYRTYCAYERDLGQALRLVAESGTKGASVAVVTRTFGIETTSPLVDALRVLGYDARLEVVDDDDIRSRFEARDYQALWTAWVSDYPSAATWIEPQYSCRGVAEGANFSGLCDRAIDREIARAKRLQADDPSTANDVWGRVDRMVMDHAAIVPLFVGQLPYFVSERVGNYQYNPVFELLLDQLWVR